MVLARAGVDARANRMLFCQILRMMFTFKKQTKNLSIRIHYFSWLNISNARDDNRVVAHQKFHVIL